MTILHALGSLNLAIKLSKQAKFLRSSQLRRSPLRHLGHQLPSSLTSTSSCPTLTFARMSWMDSWSRPSKHQAVPAPFYLLPGGEATPYCHSCGRVINSRRTAQASAKGDASSKTTIKYCSASCRVRRPGKVDREIEGVFMRFLEGKETPAPDEGSKPAHRSKKGSGGKRAKGDARLLVSCDEVEKFVFGPTQDGASVAGSGEEDNSEGHDEGTSVSESQDIGHPSRALEAEREGAAPYVDGDVLARMSVRSGTRIRPPQSISEVNGSIGGEKGRAERIDETEEMLEKRIQGQKKARQREMVRCAARRGVVFGFVAGEGGGRRKCEAVMNGKVVEPSFAKGNWSIRWRE